MKPGLPRLREDLHLLPGPVARDGQPTWTVHDPVLNRFYRIDWLGFEVLSRWSLGDPAAIAESIRTATTLQPTIADVLAVAQFLEENQLGHEPGGGLSRRLAERQARQQGSWLTRALHHYLFFRIPLVWPDRWLGRLAPYADVLYSRGFHATTLGALLLGVLLASRQSEAFLATFVQHFSAKGALSYALAIIAVKVLHELGHAITAKRAGCRVPAMGVAFLVLWPVAYTDTNDTWRLTDRMARLKVATAGIATELMIGAWALLAWSLLPPGDARSICFVLSTSSLVATLVVNASPFMRFDGYFIACDWFDFPNLHGRSFALARWHLRELLFAFGQPRPELLPRAQERWLIAFAWATWLYRLVVFLGIAVLVYHFFIKLVGIVLFVVEIVWFIALPVWNEVRAWLTLWRAAPPPLATRRRALLSGACAGVLLLAVLAPWPGRVHASGMLEPGTTVPLYTGGPGRVVAKVDADGGAVQEGQLLLRLELPEAAARLRLAELDDRASSIRAERAALSADLRASLPLFQRQAESASAHRGRWALENERLVATAAFAGRAAMLDPDVQVGDWLPGQHRWGSLVAEGPARVETYLDDEQVKRIAVGAVGRFQIDSAAAPSLRVRVASIGRDSTRSLLDGRLSTLAGGHVRVRPSGRELIPEQSIYRVELVVEEPLGVLSGATWRGALVIRTAPFSPLARYVNQGVSVLLRESGW